MKPLPSIKDLTLVKKIDIINIREQIQEDILSYFDSVAFVHNDHGRDDLCQIVVDNFKKFEK